VSQLIKLINVIEYLVFLSLVTFHVCCCFCAVVSVFWYFFRRLRRIAKSGC